MITGNQKRLRVAWPEANRTSAEAEASGHALRSLPERSVTKRDGLRPALLRSAWPFGQGQSLKQLYSVT
ncbi:hypothetical protein [Moorena producens]|uniref:hypothetical protein n=1 Tax=Moorena producens TaxID=1155739 RepID=UPI003C775F75